MNVEKELWQSHLESFLSARLITISYATASRVYPEISAPSTIPNTQGILDGFVWTLNDHVQWLEEAWVIVQVHIKKVNQRLQKVYEMCVGTLSVDKFSKAYRERSYRSRAATQDAYLSFCLVDAMLKSWAISQHKGVRESIENALPQMVCMIFPILSRSSSLFIYEAEDEFRWLFWDLLRSWRNMNTVSARTHAQLEYSMRHSLKTGSSTQHGSHSGQGESSGDLNTLLSSTGVDSSHSQLSAEMVDRTIRSFLNYVFPSRRFNAQRHRCSHCGAPFDTEAAKNEHYRYHFHSHNFLRTGEENVVRLLNPSREDFVDHCGDYDRSGYFPKVTAVLTEAYKGGAPGVIEVRRRAETPADPEHY